MSILSMTLAPNVPYLFQPGKPAEAVTVQWWNANDWFVYPPYQAGGSYPFIWIPESVGVARITDPAHYAVNPQYLAVAVGTQPSALLKWANTSITAIANAMAPADMIAAGKTENVMVSVWTLPALAPFSQAITLNGPYCCITSMGGQLQLDVLGLVSKGPSQMTRASVNVAHPLGI
ncbi:MAG TPA: hypothetical protein VF768_04220 [Holophagaceae bacterium]